jgi:hypothetical protein
VARHEKQKDPLEQEPELLAKHADLRARAFQKARSRRRTALPDPTLLLSIGYALTTPPFLALLLSTHDPQVLDLGRKFALLGPLLSRKSAADLAAREAGDQADLIRGATK